MISTHLLHTTGAEDQSQTHILLKRFPYLVADDTGPMA